MNDVDDPTDPVTAVRRTLKHNQGATRLTEAEAAALPDHHDTNLQAILAAGDRPDRRTLNRYLRDVGDKRAPGLIQSLASEGRLDLAAPDMIGVVAQVWAEGEPFHSGVDETQWISLFRANGYTAEGELAPRPTEPVSLFRGAIQERRVGMAWTADY